MSGKHNSKNSKRGWADLPTPQDMADVMIDLEAAKAAIKPFEEYASRQATLLATIKSNLKEGKAIMAEPEVVAYRERMQALSHNFRQFAISEGKLGRFFKNWLKEKGLEADYHKCFQLQRALWSAQFDEVRARIKKANDNFDAVRSAQTELDGLVAPGGGDAGDSVFVSAPVGAVISNLEDN